MRRATSLYSKFKPGDKASIIKTFTKDDLKTFSTLSNDTNPVHFDEAFAKSQVSDKSDSFRVFSKEL
jgi:acyl dehydratase